MDFFRKDSVYNTLNDYIQSKTRWSDYNTLYDKLIEQKKELRVYSYKRNRLAEHQEYRLHKYPKINQDNISEQDLSTFELSENQKFLKKFMSLNTDNRSLLLFHGVGVGKTCAAVQVAENFLDFETNMEKCIVILPPALKSNFEKELFNTTLFKQNESAEDSCMGNYYLDLIGGPDRYRNKRSDMYRAINRKIMDRYVLKGYIDFANDMNSNDRDSIVYINFIKRKYSNRLIIVDEVHNIRALDDKSVKKIPFILEDIVKYANNVRLLLLSATPMYDSPEEIRWLIRLLTLNENEHMHYNLDKLDFFDQNIKITEETRDILSRFANNYVSYMRGENPFSFPLRLTPNVNDDINLLEWKEGHPTKDMYNEDIAEDELVKNISLIGSQFTSEQMSVFEKIDKPKTKKTDKKTKKTDKKTKKTDKNNNESDNTDKNSGNDVIVNVGGDNNEDDVDESNMQTKIQLSNIIYPVSSENVKVKSMIGKEGFFKIVDQKSKPTFRFEYRQNVVKMFEEDMFEKYAPKMSKIIDYIDNSEGIVIVYSKYIYSGILPLALALEGRGYNRFNDQNLLNTSSNRTREMKGRYVIFSGESKLGNVERDLDQVRSHDNRNGNKVKIILMSQKVSEGVDFKNIREIHIMEPWYNMSRIEQIIGRGVRNNSHKHLEDKSKHNVTIYHHVNMYPRTSDYYKDVESIDYRMYRISNKKQMKISQIERVLKNGAIDCSLNREVLSFDKVGLGMKQEITTSQGIKIKDYMVGDEPYSKNCDFMECEITCDVNMEDNANQSFESSDFNKDLINMDIKYMKKGVKKAFINNWKKYEIVFMSYEEIKNEVINEKLEDIENKENILKHTLNDMVTKKVVNKNLDDMIVLSGINGRLIYRSNKYIFQPFSMSDLKLPVSKRVINVIEKPMSLRLNNIIKGVKTVIELKTKKQSRNGSDYDNKIYEKMQKSYDDVKESLGKMFKSDIEYDDEIVWSMVLDKLDQKSLRSLVRYIGDTKDNKIDDAKLLESMKKSMMYYFEDDKLSKYYDPYKKKYMKFKDNDIIEVKKIDNNDFKKNLNKELDEYLDNISKSNKPILGHVEARVKQNNAVLRIAFLDDNKDNKELQGLICSKSAQFDLKLMTEYIKKIDEDRLVRPELLKMYESNENKKKSKQLNKMDRCNTYEYLLRKKQVDFLRPMYVVRIKEREKERLLKKKSQAKETKKKKKSLKN